jgi:hypothetical protein
MAPLAETSIAKTTDTAPIVQLPRTRSTYLRASLTE